MTKSKIHKTEVLMKWIISYLWLVKTLSCRMVFIAIKQHMTSIWQKCVHIHHPNMKWHTVNMCYVVVTIAHVLISQSKKQMGITQTNLLQYLICITSFHFIQCMYYAHWKNRYVVAFLFVWYCLCSTLKLYTIQYLVTMDTSIADFHSSFNIP